MSSSQGLVVGLVKGDLTIKQWKDCSDGFFDGHDKSSCLPPCQRTKFKTILMEKTEPQVGKPYVSIMVPEKYGHREQALRSSCELLRLGRLGRLFYRTACMQYALKSCLWHRMPAFGDLI